MLPIEPNIPSGPEDEIVHATIAADPVAAAAGDGTELPPEPPVEDPYDVENPDEAAPDPGPEPDYTPDWDVIGGVQDTGDDVEPDAPDTDEDGE